MLSDDYENPRARDRAKKFAGNRAVNHVAASQIAFAPVESAQSSASAGYTATIEGKRYIALFHWGGKKETVTLCAQRAGLPKQAAYTDLWNGHTYLNKNGVLRWDVAGCDALLLEECEQTEPNNHISHEGE